MENRSRLMGITTDRSSMVLFSFAGHRWNRLERTWVMEQKKKPRRFLLCLRFGGIDDDQHRRHAKERTLEPVCWALTSARVLSRPDLLPVCLSRNPPISHCGGYFRCLSLCMIISGLIDLLVLQSKLLCSAKPRISSHFDCALNSTRGRCQNLLTVAAP